MSSSSSTSSSSAAAAAAAAAAGASNGKEQVMAQQQQQQQQQQQKMMRMKNMKKMKNSSGGGGGRKMPSAEEMIKHYEESEGMDTKQASIKVINDLQKALFRLITTSKPHHQRQQHLDVIYSRLLGLDRKLDSKPGYPQMLGLGLASAATYRTLETLAFPQLTSSFANIWNAVRSTTNTNPNN